MATGYWIGVASRDHVLKAVEGGFVQANHGREAPLKPVARGDRILFYSPRERMRAGDTVQAFTAVGRVTDDAPHQVKQAADFHPFRRQVRYRRADDAPIGPLLDRLSFTRDRPSWGLAFRRGFFAIDAADYRLISAAMGVDDEG